MSTDITLPERCDPIAAESVRQTILAQLGEGRDLVIDAKAVVQMSTSAVQLLLAAKIAADQLQSRFRIKDPSPSFLDGLSALGAREDLMEEQNV